MIIDCISDLHGHYPKLEGGDLLIVAGDLTARDEPEQFDEFYLWLVEQAYKKIIFISGNHDNSKEDLEPYKSSMFPGTEYLCDSGTEFEGLKIWGSPWTSQFPGINQHCCAFTKPFMHSLKDKWDLIPDDADSF